MLPRGPTSRGSIRRRVESEVDQPSEVDGGDAQRETELIPLHSSEPDPPVVVGHQPGDGSLHHRSPSSVVLGEVALSPCSAGLDQLFVVRMEMESPAVFGGRAPCPERASAATDPETAARFAVIETVWPAGQVAVRAWWSTMKSSRCEATGHGRGHRPGLDGPAVLGLAECAERLARSIGTVGQDLEPGLLAGQESTPVGPSGALAGVRVAAVTRPVSGSMAMWAL